jgi:hypothetical protein
MERLSFKRPSEKVISRLRNGHAVRLMKGEGLEMFLKPAKKMAMMKKFAMGKGVQLALDPEEIMESRGIQGSGIFGKKADKALKKAGIKKAVYKVGAALKPIADTAIKSAEAAAISYGVPPSIASKIGDTATQYLADPKSLQGKKGLAELKKRGLSVAGDAAEFAAEQAGIDPTMIAEAKMAARMAKDIKKSGVSRPSMSAPSRGEITSMASNAAADALIARIRERYPSGQGLYAGRGMMRGMGSNAVGCGLGMGLYAGRGMERSLSGRHTMIGMGYVPPALQSQPFSENFQFRYTLPVSK